MKMFNPTTMWFSKSMQKLEDEQEQEQLKELTTDDVLKTIDIAPSIASTNKENTLKMEQEKNDLILDKINTVVDAVKSALGIKDEIVTEETAEVNEDVQEESVSEETEVESQEQDEQPSNESEENEPSDDETVETEQAEKEIAEDGQEEPVEEKPEEEVVEEQQAEEVEETEEQPDEQEQVAEGEENSVEVTEVNEIQVPETVNEVQESEKDQLLQEIENLKAEKAEKELELQKMALSKEVEKDYGGVPGKLEDKVDMIFEIKNSALSEDTKKVIFNSLKQLSVKNLKDCEEIGHDNEVEIDENAEKNAKVEQAMKEHGLTENQAFLYVNGDRTLADAKKFSSKVRNRK